MITLTHHSDPSHGWIEVSYALVAQLGIRERITSYSYYSQAKQVFYLEEDCDATTLIKAMEAQGIEYKIESKDYNHNAPMRRMKRVGT